MAKTIPQLTDATAINALIDIIADGSAAGHITIKDASGNTRKIAVVA